MFIDSEPQFLSGYLIHVAIGSFDLNSSRDFYRDVVGATVFRSMHDRVTFGLHNLQLVCHLQNRLETDAHLSFYPRHFGLTFNDQVLFLSYAKRIVASYSHYVYSDVATRFADRPDEHKTFILQDPSGNFVEFKCYTNENSAF